MASTLPDSCAVLFNRDWWVQCEREIYKVRPSRKRGTASMHSQYPDGPSLQLDVVGAASWQSAPARRRGTHRQPSCCRSAPASRMAASLSSTVSVVCPPGQRTSLSRVAPRGSRWKPASAGFAAQRVVCLIRRNPITIAVTQKTKPQLNSAIISTSHSGRRSTIPGKSKLCNPLNNHRYTLRLRSMIEMISARVGCTCTHVSAGSLRTIRTVSGGSDPSRKLV